MTSEAFRLSARRSATAAFVIAAMCLFVRATPDAQARGPRYSGSQLLVRFKSGATNVHRQAAFARISARLHARFAQLDVEQLDVPAGMDLAGAAAALQADPAVLYAQPNFARRITAAAPNDPAWVNNTMWNLVRVNAPAAWSAFTPTARDVVVAVIDTGVNYMHPDLAAGIWTNPGEIPGNGLDDDGNGYVDDVHGADTLNRDGDPMDDNGHGTHTAGTLGAQGNNGVGAIGVAWNPQILACKFLDVNGNGSDAGAVACFDYVLALKARGVNIRVTNNSWGFLRDTAAPFPQVLKDAVDRAGQAGIINVFAAGNTSSNDDSAPFDPASFTSPSIVSVAATDEADARASFSNYGASSVDLAAPGVNIFSTYLENYAYSNGTSMAAPHVSGTFALMTSLNPGLTVDAAKARLLAGVDALPQWTGLSTTGGRLNVFQALVNATDNTAGNELAAAGWSHADIGATGATGSATLSGGAFQIAGAGADVWGSADAFHYTYRTLDGDGSIVARLSSVEYVNAWTKAGVMIRGSLSASSPHAFMLVAASPIKGIPFQRRVADGGVSASTPGTQSTAPRWVKLVREGATITGYESADGASWTTIGSDTFPFGQSVLIGLAVSSHVAGVNATATFDNVAVTKKTRPAEASPLPAGWSAGDVGAPPFAGSARGSDGAFTLTGSGVDIWNTADAFHFAYSTMTGDATIVARVTGVQAGVNAWVKAGVMIRDSLNPGSPHALMLVSSAKGLAFQRRINADDISYNTAGVFTGAPRWVKLQRSGGVFTAYESADGAAWTLVGSETIAMSANVYVGLAVTSHTTAAAATCTFDNVTIR